MCQKKVGINFDINIFIKKIKKYYKDWDPPVLRFMSQKDLTPFEILLSTILSLRTKDKVTSSASDRLLEAANNPESILVLGLHKIKQLIYPVGFYRIKANRIVSISKIILEDCSGHVPNNMEDLLKLPGVGRKTANLVLSEGFGIPSICVDTHVHRISNRIGYVNTATAEQTEKVLRTQLPKKYWSCYNKLLVGFGQVICLPILPKCTKCPVSFVCNRVQVEHYK